MYIDLDAVVESISKNRGNRPGNTVLKMYEPLEDRIVEIEQTALHMRCYQS